MVRLERRLGLSDDDTARLKIILALASFDTPVSKATISRATGLSKPLVNFHIPNLVNDGLIIPVFHIPYPRYICQPVFTDDSLLTYLTPILQRIADDSDLSHCENLGDAIKRIAGMYLLSLTLNLELDEGENRL